MLVQLSALAFAAQGVVPLDPEDTDATASRLHVLAWMLWQLLSAPFRVWTRRRRKQSRARLIEGLSALHSGHWQRAEKRQNAAADERTAPG